MKLCVIGDARDRPWSTMLNAVNASGFTFEEVVIDQTSPLATEVARWACALGLKVTCLPPLDVRSYGGRRSGRDATARIRTCLHADALVAAWAGAHAGTRHMIATAERMGLKVFVYRTDLEPQ